MVEATASALIEPPHLAPGARVALVSPSGPLRSEHELAHAVDSALSLGWEPVVGPHALSRDGYFAGSDTQRAQDLNWAIDDRRIDGIWCLRGGYGAARLLPSLSIDAIRARPKALLGYSDITALHAAWQHAGLVSFHAPTARSALTAFTRTSLVHTVVDGADGCGDAPESYTLRDGRATGRLAGGNLSLVASLCGTPWAMDFRDAIVVLEDINEASYRIDRMLTQLRLAGAFDGCVAIAFGHCTDCVETTDDGARTLDAVVRECANTLTVPTLLGIPLGHIADQWTLPLGSLATLDASLKSLTVHRPLLARG
jgi:muramoyltetrapeptide carboxypeptidase